MSVARRGADGRSTQRTRREWALYVGMKGELRDAAEIQPIGIERNALAGINLTRLTTYIFEYPEPPGGWPPPYQDRESYERFVRRIQTERPFRDYGFEAAAERPDVVP